MKQTWLYERRIPAEDKLAMGSKKGSWIVIETNGECATKNRVQVCIEKGNTLGLRRQW
jgi:hypothetical protein